MIDKLSKFIGVFALGFTSFVISVIQYILFFAFIAFIVWLCIVIF
jgi:hypothetical protein